MEERLVKVPAGMVVLEGDLAIPTGAKGIVMFAHGSGSSRHSPRNRRVAAGLREGGLGTLLIDLLTLEEEEIDLQTAHLRFDIDLLASRLVGATDWLAQAGGTRSLKAGYFGASTGAAAALVAAAERPAAVQAVVSRGGRPDLAGGDVLARVQAPTLLIAGSLDTPVVHLNKQAFDMLHAEKRLEIVPGATHLFEEAGTLDRVAALAREWFQLHLTGRTTMTARPGPE